MNSWVKTSSLVLIGAALIVLVARAQLNDSPPAPDSVVQLTAETQGLNRVAPADLPEDGTFWMVTTNGLMAPMPCPPRNPNMPIYSIADGQFIVDDTGGKIATEDQASVAVALTALANQVSDLITKVQTYAARQTMRAMGMNVPGPGDGEEGGGELPNNNVSLIIDTNSLWLEITNVANGWSYFNLHNATNQVYEIWSKPDLSQTNWDIEQELWPTDPAVTPFTVPTLDRTNLFIWARDWTGITSNGNETPEWWFWKYFGTVDLSDSTPDSSGNHTLLDDYNSQTDPNVITFSIEAANDFVNTTFPNLQLAITAGRPSYYTVLLNGGSTTTNWLPFVSTNLMVSLGSTDGVYNVSVGLRGLPTDATQTWNDYAFTLDRVPPVLTLTNPILSVAAATVIKPYLQLQGCASKPLSSLSYDISCWAWSPTRMPL